jgi:anti-anti-sigma factor
MTGRTEFPPYLRIEETRLADRTVLRCRGEIDCASVDCLMRALAVAMRVGASEVEVDLREVGFLDSSALRALLEAHRALSRRGRRLRVLASPWGARLFHLTELDGLFEVLTDTGSEGEDTEGRAPLSGSRAVETRLDPPPVAVVPQGQMEGVR